MNILVLGANGKVGSLVVKELAKTNHIIRAFVHGNSNIFASKKIEIFEGDIKSKESLGKALQNIDIVISCLGSWGTKTKDILSTAMENIIPLMENNNINRIISLTGAEAIIVNEPTAFIQKITYPLFKAIAPKILIDANEHLELLAKSSLSWTVLKSPVMNNWGNPKKFQLKDKYPSPFRSINRHSVAIALINQIEDEAFVNKAPYIFRK
jgi:putative NADH-flavin reductase